MSEVNRPRRYYLGQRSNALEAGETVLASFWRGKQEAQPGTPLAADFPFRAQLVEAGYTTLEDIDGADTLELRRRVHLITARDAELIIARCTAAMTPTQEV